MIPVIKQLVNERNDRLTSTEPTGDFVGSLATLMTRVDELENTTSGMAVMKLQDAIDETEEQIDRIQSDLEDVICRLDDAEVTITI